MNSFKNISTTVEKNLSDGKWKAETIIKNVNEFDWMIRSTKTRRHLTTIAYAGKHSIDENFISFNYGALLNNPNNITLLYEDISRVTENTIKEHHDRALEKFHQLKNDGSLPTNDQENDIKVGQVIFLNGYGQDEHYHDQLAVYKIEKTTSGSQYHTVNLSTFEIAIKSHVRPIEQKHGIGIYYKKGDTVDQTIIDDALNTAHQKLEDERKQKAADEILNKEILETKLNEGKKLVNIPTSAQALIIAQLKEDQSNPYEDYYHSSTTDTVYLAFSTNQRNNFKEFRQAAKNFEQTKDLAEAPDSFEHRENYSMGNGYYLAESKFHGYQIRKIPFDPSNKQDCNKLYIAAAEGKYYCIEESTDKTPTGSTIKANTLEIVEYSEKAIAVFGNTKAVKDDLNTLGGRFNPRLKHPDTNEKTPGWIFSKSKKPTIDEFINGLS